VADGDDADDLEGDEGLAQGGAADAEALRELALRGSRSPGVSPSARIQAVICSATCSYSRVLVRRGSPDADMGT
jgi:hypothetical protein